MHDPVRACVIAQKAPQAFLHLSARIGGDAAVEKADAIGEKADIVLRQSRICGKPCGKLLLPDKGHGGVLCGVYLGHKGFPLAENRRHTADVARRKRVENGAPVPVGIGDHAQLALQHQRQRVTKRRRFIHRLALVKDLR